MRLRFFLMVGQLVLLALPSSWGHSTLARSEPASGAVLTQSPNEIRIWFTEPIKVGLSEITVRDRNGKQVDRGEPQGDEKEQTLVHLALAEKLAPGIYEVSWRAVAQDLHVTRGKFSFEIKR
jgi:methionine-rich copper-binding protein CopC